MINIGGNKEYLFVLICLLVIIIIILIFFKHRSLEQFHDVSFKLLMKEYKLKAFFDSGCNLFYKGYPVIIINNKYYNNIYSDEYIQIDSGHSVSSVKVFYLDKVKIDKSVIKCYFIFLDVKYDVIIGYNVL